MCRLSRLSTARESPFSPSGAAWMQAMNPPSDALIIDKTFESNTSCTSGRRRSCNYFKCEQPRQERRERETGTRMSGGKKTGKKEGYRDPRLLRSRRSPLSSMLSLFMLLWVLSIMTSDGIIRNAKMAFDLCSIPSLTFFRQLNRSSSLDSSS